MPIFDRVIEEFVLGVGAEAIPVSSVDGEKRADYLFRARNVIAELKTLDKDARQEYNEKLHSLVAGWMRDRRLLVFGRVQLSLQKMHPDLKREWMTILERPMERVLRKAQRQLRQTRAELSLQNAAGLAIIANERNLLSTTASDFMAAAGSILQKTMNGRPCFPDIDGVLYISPFEFAFGNAPGKTSSALNSLIQELKAEWPQFLRRKLELENQRLRDANSS
jgi:hypothetical protein